MIQEPTHRAGNILDVLFTNMPYMVKSISTLDRDSACLSDHFGISFNIELPIGRKKGPKKKVYNYKKADWKNLNFELKRVDWGSYIGAYDPHISWLKF